MSSPTIPDLPVATVANNSDQLLMRQPAGALGTDKSVTVEKLRQIDITSLPSAPLTPQSADLFMFSQGGTNYQIRFDQVSFPKNTRMWFYHDVASDIPGWALVTSAPDSLLAVKGGSEYVAGSTTSGNWQQHGVGGGSPGGGLTIAQMPQHNHTVSGTGATGGTGNKVRGYRQSSGEPIKNWSTNNQGSGDPHNHGSIWRPQAAVGILMSKN